jgi:hypothetical protein
LHELRWSLEETGRLDKPLTKGQLMMVMRAKRIPLPKAPNLEFLRNKLKEVDEQLYDANMATIAQSNDQRHEKTRSRAVDARRNHLMNANVSLTADYSCMLQTPTAPRERRRIHARSTETKENNV